MLVDPWLVGNLVFADSEWLYKGVKRVFKPSVDAAKQIAANTDVILLTMVRTSVVQQATYHETQSLPDHAHIPTLQALPKSIPVVGSPSAAAVATDLGFATVHVLDHGQSIDLCDGKLTVKATQGMQPPTGCVDCVHTTHQARWLARHGQSGKTDTC